MSTDRDERIRQRAYELWEQAGKPHGEDMKHWLQASGEFSENSREDAALRENLSVLGEGSKPARSARTKKPAPAAEKAPRKGSAGKLKEDVGSHEGKAAAKPAKAEPAASAARGKNKSVKITTGKEPVGEQVKRVEGP